MEDEKYVFFQDVREKKVTGYSARKQRSHCGKGGRVKLPSDYLTKKELKNMSGECKTFRLNSPMKWKEFKAMPEDLQIAYIKAIKEKYNPPIVAIAKMMEIDRANLSRCLMSLGFEKGERGHRPWDKMGFAEWCFGLPKTEECQSVQEEVKEEIPDEEVVEEEIPVAEEVETCEVMQDDTEKVVLNKRAEVCYVPQKTVPEWGSMKFTGKAYGIMETLSSLLGSANVSLSVQWEVVED